MSDAPAASSKQSVTKKASKELPDWRNSEAKQYLKELLEKDEDGYWHNLPPRELYHMSELFEQYKESNFITNLKNLKAVIKKEADAVSADEQNLKKDQQVYKPKDVDARGKKRWDRSEAKPLLT